MSWKRTAVWIGLGCGLSWGAAARAEDAKGLVTDTGLGSFVLDEAGTSLRFNLSSRNTRYEPATWRPTRGDRVRLGYTPTPNKRGAVVLAVDEVELVKAGPDTLVSLDSPVAATITEVGRSGIKAKIPGGQIVRFGYERGFRKTPPGWVPAPGEEAIVHFRTETGGGFAVGRVLSHLEKAP